MKRKLYTKSHNADLLKEIDNQGAQFSAAEHAYFSEHEFADKYASRETLLRWFLSDNAAKLSALAFLIRHVHDSGFANILSMGAGTCVLEYLLKLALPEESRVVAADFDSYFIDKAKILLPGIVPVKFDFFKDDVAELQKATGAASDVAVFLGSAYVMDDAAFVGLFRRLGETGTGQIIDFHAGYLSYRAIALGYYYGLLQALWSPVKALVMRKTSGVSRSGEEFLGKLHGYSRSRDELRRLYREAGINSIKELKVGPYEYVAICNFKGQRQS